MHGFLRWLITWLLTLYPVAKLLYIFGLGPPPIEYHIEVQRKGEGEQYQPPVVSIVQMEVWNTEEGEGYASVNVTCRTDRPCEVRASWGMMFQGAGPDGRWEEVCDPFAAGGFRIEDAQITRRDEIAGVIAAMDVYSGIVGPDMEHLIKLGDIWYAREAPVQFCLVVVAWEPQYRGVPRCYGYSKTVRFTVP